MDARKWFEALLDDIWYNGRFEKLSKYCHPQVQFTEMAGGSYETKGFAEFQKTLKRSGVQSKTFAARLSMR